MSTGTGDATWRADDPDLERGFSTVDDQPDPSFLVAGMEATAEFPAVRQLRAWELERLTPRAGDALLDVGCGIGDVARSISPTLQPGGRVVGIDASQAMLEVARERADAAGLTNTTFRRGDASAIDEPDASFDMVRSERVLQWLPDLRAAIAEMARVLRPGGRLCVVDSDWRTLALDLPDPRLSAALTDALVASRGEPAMAGGKLLNLCRDAGLVDIDHAAAAHVWSAWDPDASVAPPGLFPISAAVGGLAHQGVLDEDTAAQIVDGFAEAARKDRLCMSLTMIAVAGRAPAV
jgi:SAM-dependent methyltransferase